MDLRTPLENCYEFGEFSGKNISKNEYIHLIKIFDHQAIDIVLYETIGSFENINSLLEININTNKKIVNFSFEEKKSNY